MNIARIDYMSKEVMQTEFSDVEIIKLHNKIVLAYNQWLISYGVKAPWKNNSAVLKAVQTDFQSVSDIVKKIEAKELQLIFLCKYKGHLVHKDLISEFVRSKIPSAALDQQVRHLATQDHWNVLNKGNKIPDVDMKVPSGFHYLVSLETPNPNVFATINKREGRLRATSFSDLKTIYNKKCATCGIKEGSKDMLTNTIVELQQGHMNPREELTLANTIPQCQYCNQTCKDNFRFDADGRVVYINNANFLLQSPQYIQDEMWSTLLRTRQGRTSKK